MADWTSSLINLFVGGVSVRQIYEYYYKYAVPALYDSSYELLYSMIIFALMPYLTIFYKGYRERINRQQIQDEYENY